VTFFLAHQKLANALDSGITLAQNHGSYHKTERVLSKLQDALKGADKSALKRLGEFEEALKQVKPSADMLKSLEYAHERLKQGSEQLVIKALQEDNLVGQKAILAEKVHRRLVKMKKPDQDFQGKCKEIYPWSSYFNGA
jgi:hypothetical protein